VHIGWRPGDWQQLYTNTAHMQHKSCVNHESSQWAKIILVLVIFFFRIYESHYEVVHKVCTSHSMEYGCVYCRAVIVSQIYTIYV